MKKIVSLVLAAMLLVMMLPAVAMGDEIVITREALGLPELEITNDTVTYLTWDNQKSVNTYAANLLMQEIYGCKLKVIRTTYAELSSKAASLKLSGNSPDLIKFRDQEFPAFITNGIVSDVTEWLDFDDPLYADLKDTADMYLHGGKYYVMPVGKMYNNNIVYYWTSYFDDLGLETPWELYQNGEWTLDTMRELMKELTMDDDRDGIMDIYGLVLNPIYSFPMSGEDFVNYDTETGLFENNLRSPALAEYFNFIYETSTAGEDSRLMSLEDISCFAAKDAVMMLGERWVLGDYYEQIKEGEVGIAPAPRMHEDDEVTDVRGRIDVYWVGADCPNPAGVQAFLACSRAVALNEDLAEELARRAGQEVKEWPEEVEEILDEINDPEKFDMRIIKSLGVGTWGNNNDGVFDLLSITSQFEVPWTTAMEKHYPLLQESIDIANGTVQ
ncbi:MAG: extracellular solute-binding protein [Clostridiales bacterium]|nr:extracellular solute-binding protein [Clostridiales bacterium]